MVPRHRSAGPARSGPTTGKRGQRGAAPARAAHTTSSVRAAHAGPMRCLCASNRPTSAATKRACVSTTCASLGASHCWTARRRARAQRPCAAHPAGPRSMQRRSGWHAPAAQQSARTLQRMAGHIMDRSGRAAQARVRRARGTGHTIGQHAGGPRSGGAAARRAWHGRADQREDGVPPRQRQAPRAEEQAAAHARAPAGGLAAPEAQQLAGAQVVDGHQVGARADGHAHKAQAAAQVHGLAPPRRAPARRRARVGVARVWVDGAPGASE